MIPNKYALTAFTLIIIFFIIGKINNFVNHHLCYDKKFGWHDGCLKSMRDNSPLGQYELNPKDTPDEN